MYVKLFKEKNYTTMELLLTGVVGILLAQGMWLLVGIALCVYALLFWFSLVLDKDKSWKEAARAGRRMDAVNQYREQYKETLAKSLIEVQQYINKLGK